MKKESDIVFNILHQMLANSPKASYVRLNGALRSTLGECIAADLPFQRDTFTRVYYELRGGYWFGDSGGSPVQGEHFYEQACACNHSSAQQSFEAFSERPAVLWEEDSKTPVRLHVGSRFHWQGYFVDVTSMRNESLVACTYKDETDAVHGIKVGAIISHNPAWVITASKQDGAAIALRVRPSRKDEGSRSVDKRFIIPYSEIETFRRTAKKRVAAIVAKIESNDPEKDGPIDGTALSKEISSEHFRHWELEIINAAFVKRKKWVANRERIEAWRQGANGAWLDIQQILVRVKDDLVECSNGNSVSRSAAERALPILLDNRKKRGPLDLPLGGHRVQSIGANGVKIGCTVVPWAEIDLIAPKLQGAK